jgi:hypothetical protein
MSPVELPATLAKAGTAISAFTWKKLTTKTTGKPAPTTPDGNLWIDIDVSNENAVFHCRDEERVRDQKPRFVSFRADQDCLLGFTNPAVFGYEVVQLFAHNEKILQVLDGLGKHRKIVSETSCEVYTMTSAREPTAKMFEIKAAGVPVAKRPPVIVVP